MKIIEGLKSIKDLVRKAEDLRNNVHKHHVYLDYETPVYGDKEKQTAQISKWIQSHSDVLKEILSLKLRIQKTNCSTVVKIKLGEETVEKTISEWIVRRLTLSEFESSMWKQLNDRNLREERIKTSSGEIKETKIVRCYDPSERDKKKEIYRSEPMAIDSALEITNAITDLVA